jgi:tRNA A37 threonylcarbamoyladenosine biosynthesis protein TsaE
VIEWPERLKGYTLTARYLVHIETSEPEIRQITIDRK